MSRIDPQKVAAADRSIRGGCGSNELRSLRDAFRQALAADLVEIVAERDHHRVPARAPDVPGVAGTAFETRDASARLADLTEPLPPFLLPRSHVALGERRHVNRRRFAAVVAASRLTASDIGVFVEKPAERMTELVRRDERAEGIPARRRGKASADAAVGVAVADDQDLARRRCRALGISLDDGLGLGGTVTPRALMLLQPPSNCRRKGVVRRSRISGSQSMPDCCEAISTA